MTLPSGVVHLKISLCACVQITVAAAAKANDIRFIAQHSLLMAQG
jgi:uncharacterized OsmC-like protein